MLSEQMSLEWGKEGIRVNTVSPGFIDSGMSADHYVDPVERKKERPWYQSKELVQQKI